MPLLQMLPDRTIHALEVLDLKRAGTRCEPLQREFLSGRYIDVHAHDGVSLTDRASAAATCQLAHYLTFLKPEAPRQLHALVRPLAHHDRSGLLSRNTGRLPTFLERCVSPVEVAQRVNGRSSHPKQFKGFGSEPGTRDYEVSASR